MGGKALPKRPQAVPGWKLSGLAAGAWVTMSAPLHAAWHTASIIRRGVVVRGKAMAWYICTWGRLILLLLMLLGLCFEHSSKWTISTVVRQHNAAERDPGVF